MTLASLNAAGAGEARAALARCCGSRAWLDRMLASRPWTDPAALHAAADGAFASLAAGDWLEAFAHHPRIGDLEALRRRFATTAGWAEAEQAGSTLARDATLAALADGNRDYEARFGHRFIVFASGRTAAEMFAILRARLANDPETERRIAAGEAARIAHLRLDKLLEEET